MSGISDTARIMNGENQEQLIKARNAELQRVTKLQFLLALLKKRKSIHEIEFTDKDGLEKAIKTLIFQNYLRLQEDNLCVLGLDNYKTASINYTERKAVRDYIIQKLRETYTPIERFGRKIKEEFPEVFETNANSNIGQNSQLIELEIKRRCLQVTLVEIQSKKCALLKAAAELKMGPHLQNELELVLAECKMNQMKTELLRGYFVNTFITQTDFTIRAIKEASLFVDAALEPDE